MSVEFEQSHTAQTEATEFASAVFQVTQNSVVGV